jgi:hypothetical protein
MKAPFDMPKHVGEWLTFGEHVLLHVTLVTKTNTQCRVSGKEVNKDVLCEIICLICICC